MDKRPDSLQMLDGSFAKGEHSATIATRSVESLEALLHSERRRFHRAVAVFANINGDLEDRIVTLEEMLRLSEGLRKQEGGRNEG